MVANSLHTKIQGCSYKGCRGNNHTWALVPKGTKSPYATLENTSVMNTLIRRKKNRLLFVGQHSTNFNYQ